MSAKASPAQTAQTVESPSEIAQLVEAMQAQTASILASQPKRKILPSEHRVTSPFNPTGKKRTLPVVVYQNGARLEESMLTDEEIDLLGQLKPGRFCNSLVTVYQDMSKPDRPWHITYKNGKDMRLVNKDQFRNLAELLKRIATEPADN